MEEITVFMVAFAFAIHEINNLLLICMANSHSKKAFACANKKMMKQLLKSIK